LTWRHDSILKSALVSKSTVELYCDLDGLHTQDGRSILSDVIVQAQRLDHVILERPVHGRHRIALVELTCPSDTDAKRAEERKTARYIDRKTALSNEGWDCSLYMIKVGVRGYILKSVKDRLWCIPGLGPCRLLVRYWADDERRQQDFSWVFVPRF
jgi:hypothetical protein